MMKSNQKSLVLPLLACSTLCTAFANASDICYKLENGCETPTGWYVGGEIGRSDSDFGNDRLLDLAATAGLTLNSFTLDDSDSSHGLLFGYQFNQFLALEAGYRDLGEYSSELIGMTTNAAQFNQLASALAPESGDGGTLGVIVSYPFAKGWKLSGKVGVWEWENETDVTASTPIAGLDSDGRDIYYGLETSYQVTSRLQAYLSAVRYEFDRDESDNLSLGLRYFFGETKSSKPKAAPTPSEPAKASALEKVMEAAPVDSDGDGIYNDKDQCLATPPNHVVDSKGCTVYEEVQYQHQLTIYYSNNSSVIDSTYFAKIQDLVNFAQDKGIKYMQVVGHTSAPGEADYNQWLSEERAKSLQTILVERHGYSAEQIETKGNGELAPAVPGNTETAHSKNRRIEVNLSATGRNPKLK